MTETIAAISTPPGNGAIGIVRLSGPDALGIAQKIFQNAKAPWQSHRAYYGQLFDPVRQTHLDHCLMLYMQNPRSYTGEDMIEFQCHGGRFLVNSVLQLCLELGTRLAEAGEFTQRAFLNGRLDLTQAEAVADLIHGQSRQGLNLAAHQLEGHLSQAIRQVRSLMIAILASIEANIDFPDEVDPPDLEWISQGLTDALTQITKLLASSEAGRIWKEGLKLAIIGEPNVGKSTLLNALLRFDRAIVSDIPGTTRDTVEDDYNLKGIPIRVIDTAGLRETDDQIEAIGIERSQKALQAADLILAVADLQSGLSSAMSELLSQYSTKKLFLVWNKSDLVAESAMPALPEALLQTPALRVSANSGTGIEALEDTIFGKIQSEVDLTPSISINQRHRVCLLRAQEALLRMSESIDANLPTDFLAIDLKEAIVAFGEMIGESVSEEVINEIFHRFCVGK